MSNVIPIRPIKPATDLEKAQVFLRILQTASKYIAFAQVKGVYKGWKFEGSEVCALIDRMVLEHGVKE